MSRLGVEIPAAMGKPQRSHFLLASIVWLAISLPFFRLAYLYRNWRNCLFVEAAHPPHSCRLDPSRR